MTSRYCIFECPRKPEASSDSKSSILRADSTREDKDAEDKDSMDDLTVGLEDLGKAGNSLLAIKGFSPG